MNREVELKFSVPAHAARGLIRLPALAGWRSGGPSSRRIHSVYYDTSQRQLRAEGVALRLRRVGRRWWQTIKSAGTAGGGLHSRDEWETPTREGRFDFTRLPDCKLKDDLAGALEQGSLQPVFTTDFIRRSQILEWPNGDQLELSIDRGDVVAGAARAPIAEIELEVKAGAARRAFDVAELLLEHLDIRLENVSKAERGYRLVSGEVDKPVKAKPVQLDRALGAHAAFAVIVQSCLVHLQANEAGVLQGGDAEYVHQMRVALRRMRSAISVFGRLLSPPAVQPIREELRWFTKALDGARNWDVFELETLASMAQEFSGAAGFQWLLSAARAQREQANRVAREAAASKRYQRLLLRLGGWLLEGPWNAGAPEPLLSEFAREELKRRHKRLKVRAEALVTLTAPQRHDVRIVAKKLRYAAEFFASLYQPKSVRGYIAALADLQAVLGGLNDVATTDALLRTLTPAEPTAEQLAVLSMLRGWGLGVTQARLGELDAAWRHFAAQKRFW